MDKNRWFLLKDIGVFNGKRFSCITSIYKCEIKYNILDFKFDLSVDLIWFSLSWRRREGEEITYLESTKKIDIDFDEILEIPYFKKMRTNDGNKIENEISNNIAVKQAMIERYASKLGSQLYNDNKPDNNIYTLYKRYCGVDNILTTLQKTYKDDDFSRIMDISSCVILAY